MVVDCWLLLLLGLLSSLIVALLVSVRVVARLSYLPFVSPCCSYCYLCFRAGVPARACTVYVSAAAMPFAYAQMAFKGSTEPYGRSQNFGTTIACTSPAQHIYADLWWTPKMEHHIMRGGPLDDCYSLGTVHGGDVGRCAYAGPAPLGFDAMVDSWMNDTHAFERVVRSIFGGTYTICFFCQSYGEQWGQEGAPGYLQDASGPIEVFSHHSTMPADHYFRFDLTNNHYDRQGRQTLTINDWHTATQADWVDRGNLGFIYRVIQRNTISCILIECRILIVVLHHCRSTPYCTYHAITDKTIRRDCTIFEEFCLNLNRMQAISTVLDPRSMAAGTCRSILPGRIACRGFRPMVLQSMRRLYGGRLCSKPC